MPAPRETDMADTASAKLYNNQILALAAALVTDDRLPNPDASAQVDSPLCGSRIRVDVSLAGDGKVAAYGQQVRACALGQSSAALMKRIAPGQTLAELKAGAAAVEAMLKHAAAPPTGIWSAFAVLEPARAHKSRHASILLPFRGILEAMDKAGSAERDNV